MATRTAARRPMAGTPGFKALVTAVTLAATLGGWAVIAAGAQKTNLQTNNTLPPVPTLVPTPAPFVAQPSTGTNSTANLNGTRGSTNNQPSSAAPSLRSVTINPNLLPRPMAITRTSR